MKKTFTSTAISIIFLFLITASAHSEIVLNDTFENVPDNSRINVDYDAAGRQSGTIAPTNYVTGGNSPGTYTNLIISGEVSQLGPPMGGYFSPNANFTDLEENFVVECDGLIGDGATWLDVVVGSSVRSKANGTDGHGVTFQKPNTIWFYENHITLASHPVNINMASNMHIAFVVANKSYGGDDKPRVSLFVNDKAMPIYTLMKEAFRYEYYTREGSNSYANNFLNFLSFNQTNPNFFDNVTVKNIAKSISTKRWLTDSDLELDNSKSYSHAVNFNTNANVTIAGVTFNHSTNGQFTGANWTLRNDVGNAWRFQNYTADMQITGEGKSLVGNYIDTVWRTASSLELTGLNPGDVNSLKLYGIAELEAGPDNNRENYLAMSVGGQYEINQNEFGDGTGIIYNILYTVPDSGNITIAMSPLGIAYKNQYRWFAFSNMEDAPPLVVENISASQGTYSNKVVVTWDSASGAEKYQVYRNDTNDSSSAVSVSGELTSNSFDDATVTPNIYYYYWVKSGNTNGWSGFGDSTLGFATDSAAPFKPANVSPINGAKLTSFPVTLEGSAYSGGWPMKSSQWQINNNTNFSYVEYDSGEIISTAVTFVAPSSAVGTQTFWRVRYRDTLNSWSDWSDNTSFSIERNTNSSYYFYDSFNNITGSGDVNMNYYVSRRQYGTTAPLEYSVSGVSEIGQSSVNPNELTLIDDGAACSPNRSFEKYTDFKIECDVEPSVSGTGITFGKNTQNLVPVSSGGMGFIFYGGGSGRYDVYIGNTLLGTFTNNAASAGRLKVMISATTEVFDNEIAYITLYVNGTPLPLHNEMFIDPSTNLYDHMNYFYTYEKSSGFSANYVTLYSYGGNSIFDNLKISPVNSILQTRTWDNDNDLWIGTTNPVEDFTHAVNLNWTNNPPTINVSGLDFECPGYVPVPENLMANDTIPELNGTNWKVIGPDGWVSAFKGTYESAPLPSGNGADIAEYCIYGWGSSVGIVLSNLWPGSSNIFTIYGRAFASSGPRVSYVAGSDGGIFQVNENEITTSCQIVEYKYLAGADGVFAITLTPTPSQDYMLYGFSNVETGIPEIGMVIGNLLSVIGIFFALRKK